MKTILVMVHGVMQQRLVPKLIEKHCNEIGLGEDKVQVIALALPDKGCTQVHYIEEFKKQINEKVEYSSVCAIVLESNYGYPSQEMVVDEIFLFALENFTKARVIAFSSTAQSLALASQLDDRIHVCHNTMTSVDEILATFTSLLGLKNGACTLFRERIYTRDLPRELVNSLFVHSAIFQEFVPALRFHQAKVANEVEQTTSVEICLDEYRDKQKFNSLSG